MENEVLYIEQLASERIMNIGLMYIPFCVSLQGRSGAYGEREYPSRVYKLCAVPKKGILDDYILLPVEVRILIL
jgi:hypothetical protein